MPKKAMTIREAHEMWGECLSAIQALAEEFPCPECDGVGEHYPDGCYHPCLECHGNGFLLPDEEDE